MPAGMDYEKSLPARMRQLPRDEQGRPVPFFVAKVDGVFDFRIMDERKFVRCMREALCWVCGQEMGSAHATFLIGPMCAVNHISAEPPSHKDCAVYSAKHCPFLTTPRRRRREKDMPSVELTKQPAGVMIRRNPGVALVWVSKRYRAFRNGEGVLFDIGDALAVEWYCEGRPATRGEVLHSIDTGLPLLHEMAEREGSNAVKELERLHRRALALVPA